MKISRAVPPLLLAAVLAAGAYAAFRWLQPPPQPAPAAYGMFEWRTETVEDPEAALRLVKTLNLSRWYQEFPDPPDPEATAAFVEALSGEGVAVYALFGATEWGFEEDGASFLAAMEPIAAYNAGAQPSQRIQGVMADIEPYIRSRWKEDPEGSMELYLSCMAQGYRFARENGLVLINCIPRHYDDQGLTPQLEELIGSFCDEAAVMNYGCGTEAEAIATEAEIALRHGKTLHCILEFQRVGKHGLTEEETYRNKGIAAAQAAWNQVAESAPELSVIRDYHYAKPLEEILFSPE